MTITPFDPKIRSIRVLDRQFLLEVTSKDDGTAYARISEVSQTGKTSLVCWSLRQRNQTDWCFIIQGLCSESPDPHTAANAVLRKWILPINSKQ